MNPESTIPNAEPSVPETEAGESATTPPTSTADWSSLGLSEKLLELVTKAGYRSPTPVQAQAIPLVIEGNDVLASAATGSGKTAAFVLPTVQRFAGKEGTYVLALSPTREIAQQTAAVFETFGGPLGLRATVLIGGSNMRLEEQALMTYPQIIVATPGRLCDHLERGNVWLDFIQTLILDEADRMLDMGFSDQLAKITDVIPTTRQTLMFSATFAPSVERLARSVMHSPKEVAIKRSAENTPKIEERVVRMREEEKVSRLIRLFEKEPGTIIVFCRSKDRVSKLWRSLHSRCIYDATFIHSDRLQADREKAIAEFKSGQYRILIATDVAGRGIDVDDVAHVVNFDLPMDPEDYVHRIGRTGRRGKTGVATTFMTDRDKGIMRQIEKLTGRTLLSEEERNRDLGEDRGGGRDFGRGGRGGGDRGGRSGGGGGSSGGGDRGRGGRGGERRDERPRDSSQAGPRDSAPREGAGSVRPRSNVSSEPIRASDRMMAPPADGMPEREPRESRAQGARDDRAPGAPGESGAPGAPGEGGKRRRRRRGGRGRNRGPRAPGEGGGASEGAGDSGGGDEG
jgi:ATP-dependent RNA helicase RhlE